MNKTITIYISFLVSSIVLAQGGGMWIPTELNEKEMKEMGMEILAQDIFNSNQSSIKDAVAHFGGGCTSEVISPQGLLLTNHHCGYGQIQSHSTVEHNYLQDGFWAKSFKDELPNEGLTATFIVDIKEVTEKVLQGVSDSDTEEERSNRIKDNIEIITKNQVKKSWQETAVKPFYKGNKYYLFITETYKDIRLVGTPPSSIGKYGSDTDNWVWPRHTGDFSMFRIYADKNNRPAEYSKDNVPYQPKHFLPVNVGGIEEGDFTFVFGFPGRTNEYLPAAAMAQTTQKLNPTKIKLRDEALKIIDKYMRKDEAIKIQYASKYARIANYWKKWIGENQGIEKSGAVALRQAYEKEFQKRVNAKNQWKSYQNLLPELNNLYTEIEPYNYASDYFDEALYRNSETFRVALLMNNLLNYKGTDKYDSYKKRIVNYLSGLYKNYNADVDAEVSAQLWEMYQENMPADFRPEKMTLLFSGDVKKSVLTGGKEVNGAKITTDTEKFFTDDEALILALENDAVVQAIGEVEQKYEQTVSKKRIEIQSKIDQKMRTYMKAQMEVMSDEKTFFPDANSTLRVTYGKVNGYEPRDAVKYLPQTFLDGVIEKYVPGDYEFDLPQKIIDLYNEKDYGQYAQDGKLPVNFIATNHTTGGNSGSPALDAEGNLIGLNFDRVWEGTMSDLYYDPEICRNIMVDARYILFIIDKYANAQRLIDEMKLVK